MKPSPSRTLIRHLHSWLSSNAMDEGSDHELLGRFLQNRDEQAFLALVQRYGAMVLRVCRRQLHDAGDAEDAFQATFLVLARRAQALRPGSPVGPWLYGVAYRVARRLWQQQRPMPTSDLDQTPSTPADDREGWQEMVTVLDEELCGLAEKYRLPLILHYLQGQPQQQAAEQLGWSLRTTKRRLADGRELLRQRLVRRGLEMAMVPLVLELSVSEAPAALVQQAATTATRYAAGEAAANGAGSAKVLALAEGVLKTMTISKLKLAMMLVLALTGLGARAVYLSALEQPLPDRPQAAAETPRSQKVAAPRLDQSGDLLPAGAVARLGTSRFRHAGEAAYVAFSPNGQILASASNGHLIQLWEVATGKLLRRLDRRFSFVTTLAFSPDGKTLASGGLIEKSENLTVQLWDVAAGNLIRQMTGDEVGGTPRAAVFSRDGRTMITAGDKGLVQIWDVATGKELRQFKASERSQMALALSPDGTVLASGGDDTMIRLWDLASGKQLGELKGHDGKVSQVAFSGDGKTLASASSNSDATVCLWDAATGKKLHQFKEMYWAAGSPDSKLLALSGLQASQILEVATGKVLQKASGFAGPLAFSPDGALLAAGGECAIRLLDVATGQVRLPMVGHQGHLLGGGYLSDQSFFTYSADGTARSWDPTNGKETGRFDWKEVGDHWHKAGRCAALSPDNQLFAARDLDGCSIHLWDARTGKKVREWAEPGKEPIKRGSGYLAFSPDSKILVAHEKDQLRLLDVATGKEVRRLQLKAEAEASPIWWFSPDSRLLIAPLLTDKEIGMVVRELNTGTERFTLLNEDYWFVFSPESKLLATRNQRAKMVRIYDAGSGKVLREIPGTDYPKIFAPDGRYLITAGEDNKTIHVWNVVTGNVHFRIEDHEHQVGPLIFSGDGKTLVSTEYTTGRIRLWEIATGKERQHLGTHGAGIWRLAYSPDRQTLASIGTDASVLIWDNGRDLISLPEACRAVERPDALWNDLGDADASKAYRAMLTLLRVPEKALALLSVRLRPIVPPDPRLMPRLIGDLDSAEFARRQKAMHELESLGKFAEPLLKKALADKPSLEVRQRIDQVLDRLKTDLITDADALRALRALEVLEHIDTPEAKQVLEKLVQGAPGHRLTEEARAALQRLQFHAKP